MYPVIAIIGRSNSGKTTLIEKLVKQLIYRGYNVSVIKHTNHDFKIDHHGKDSHRFKEAGASSVVVMNNKKMALFSDIDNSLPQLDMVMKHLNRNTDLVIVEGFKDMDLPMIEVIGNSPEPPLFKTGNKNVSAIVSDNIPEIQLPCFRRDDIEEVSNYIEKNFIHK